MLRHRRCLYVYGYLYQAIHFKSCTTNRQIQRICPIRSGKELLKTWTALIIWHRIYKLKFILPVVKDHLQWETDGTMPLPNQCWRINKEVLYDKNLAEFYAWITSIIFHDLSVIQYCFESANTKIYAVFQRCFLQVFLIFYLYHDPHFEYESISL